jgi:hypothetical protein
MGSTEAIRSAMAYGTLALAGRYIAPGSAEGDAAEIPVVHAVAGFRIVSMPADDQGHVARLLVALWPLLAGAAIEIRWVAAQGVVTCYVLARCTADDAQTASAEIHRLMHSTANMARALLPGWTLVGLGEEEIPTAARPFALADVGDFLRREQEVTLSGGRECDVPALIGVDPSELGLLVQQMADSEHPVVLSLAAAPTEIDEAERSVLLGELAALERAISEASYPESVREYPSSRDSDDPPSVLARAAATLQRRVIAPERLGFLRVSLASSGPLQPTLIAAAQEALAATALTLEWVPAFEQGDRDVCVGNIETISFTPWGIQASEQRGHESVNDCYLASLEEIASELRLPIPDGFLPLTHELVDPAPRPAVSAVPSKGRTLGTSLLGGRMLALSHSDRLRHTYVVGQTGTGKSTLLLNLAVQDIREGKGVCVIDPHGDLVDGILDRFPEERIEDLILFDPTNMDRPVPMNLLDANTPEEQDYVVQQMIGMLYRIYDPGHQGIIGPRFENMFRNAALVAMAHPDGGTLLDIARLFTDDRFLEARLSYATDPTVRSFWIDEMGQTTSQQKSEVLGWFTAKFGAFASNRFMRAVVGQRESAVSMREVMDTGKVLLVKLPKGTLGETNALWLGLIFIVRIQMAALARGSVAPAERREFNLYVDEFQNFAMTDFDLLVAEARKYGLALTLAHQHVGQLSPELRAAVFGNVASWVMFRLGMPDAVEAAKEIEGYSARDLTRLANYRCVVRTSVEGQVLPPFDLLTMPPSDQLSGPAMRLAAEKLSALKYGRPMETVEAEFLESWGVGAPKRSSGDAGSNVGGGKRSEGEARRADRRTPYEPILTATDDGEPTDVFGPPVFGESVLLRMGRRVIAAALRRDDLDGALAAFRKMFTQMKQSADCWAVYGDMGSFFTQDEAREKYEALRVELEARAAGGSSD